MISWIRNEQNPNITKAYELGAKTYLVKPGLFTGRLAIREQWQKDGFILARVPQHQK